MKVVNFLTAIVVSSIAFAQEAPQSPEDTEGQEQFMSAPAHLSDDASPELPDLMRAQTEAIKALSDKVDALEDRSGQIEARGR
ncbi:MAG: hypothetical protein ACREXS_18130 [Gammaproteobacteria bacterium]